MLLLFILGLILRLINASDNFQLFGITVNFEIIYETDKTCNYDNTCINLVCDTLYNTSLSNMGLAFIVLFPIAPVTCTKIPFISNATMIGFIMDKNNKITKSIACDNVGDCFSESCNLYKEEKIGSVIAFTGQCK